LLPKISIIIPVYNVSLYLRTCINSLINQTLKEIEIICINDGSTDNSLQILKEYALIDPRIKVINQKNKGAGVARNEGIKQATGKYLICLDADDFFEKNMLECMYNIAQKDKSDRVVCSFYMYDNRIQKDVEIITPSIPKNKTSPLNTKDTKDNLFNISFGVAWIELYKMDTIKNNNITFGNWSYCEDSLFVWHATAFSKKTSLINTPFIHYRFWNEKQATFSLNNQKKIIGLSKTFTSLYNIFNQKNIYNSYKEAYILRLIESIKYELDNGWDNDCVNSLLSLLPPSIVKEYTNYIKTSKA